MVRSASFAFLFLPFVLLAGCKSAASPEIVVYNGVGFEIYTANLSKSTVIPLTTPVGSFSIAPDGSYIAFSSAEGRARMGQVFRLEIKSGRTSQLTGEPFWILPPVGPPDPDSADALLAKPKERYSDVEVSPDSRHIAFGVHGVTDTDGDDAIGLAGPIGILDTQNLSKHVLASTLDVDGYGPAYANTARWSLDGKVVMMAFEVIGATTDSDGNTLRFLEPKVPKPFDDCPTTPVNWLSGDEILFVCSSDSHRSGIGKLFVVSLSSGVVRDAAPALRIPPSILAEVVGVDVNDRYVLINYENHSDLFSRNGEQVHSWPTRRVRLRLFH